jgi:hypothetical protein
MSDFFETQLLPESERTKANLDAIADHGGRIGYISEGYACRGEPWSAHGYTARWFDTAGVGNQGSLWLMAEPGTPQARRLEQGQVKHLLARIKDAGGFEACCDNGALIWEGRHRPYPEKGRLDDEWGFRSRTFWDWRSPGCATTRVWLAPLSRRSVDRLNHARWKRVIALLEKESPVTTAQHRLAWAIAQMGRVRDDLAAAAVANSHLPAAAWDRDPPRSNAAVDAWCSKWQAIAPRRVDEWPVMRDLARARRGAQ